MDMVLLYITTRDKLEAAKLAEVLVESRLAACANILPGMTSVYRWEGKVQRAWECVLIVKTRAELAKQASELVKKHHSYENPCILALPVAGGAAPYLQWLEDETAPAAKG